MRALRWLALLAACALIAPAHGQSADKYPERQIRIIVPYPPGGSVDVLGRLLAQRMQENWGQSVIVENRPGAGTMIGTAAAAKAEPDGYTLIIVVSGHTTNPALRLDAVRRHQGFPADLAHRTHASRALRASVITGEGREGAGRAGQDQDTDAQLRLRRRRKHDAPD